MTAPESDPAAKNWKVFLPHDDDVRIQDIDLFQDFTVVIEKTQAIDRLRVYDFHAKTWKAIEFPEPVYAASPAGTPDYESSTYRYNYQSFITPPSVFDYDVKAGKSALLKRQEVLGGYDPSQYSSERLWAAARDGTKVLYIRSCYKKGFERNGRGSAVPLWLWFLRFWHAADVFEFTAELARPRHGLRHRTHSRRRRDGREVA